ncbi:ribosomal protein S7 [Tothia fuscella]|uniref:Small ribosomal subunit protein uS7m n=1 Tax=Tothia fuscella TaxID=1048955 RepID=A0A9P4U2J4_9PEZI|nr:ribosomal protein S7 [Tothia fuscella]
MPPRINLLSASKALPFRPRAPMERWRPSMGPQLQQLRLYSNPQKDLPVAETTNEAPNTDDPSGIPHVSEEAAAMSKIAGEPGPDLSTGTPIEEIVQGDKEAQEKLPKVMKDAINAAKKPSGSRGFSTSTRVRLDVASESGGGESVESTIISAGTAPLSMSKDATGVKFGLPALPLPKDFNLHHRYDPLIEQFTGLLIQDGKKGVAQRNVSAILSHLRTSPPPQLSPSRSLLPGHPPPSALPLNPILYLTLAIDSIAPLLRIRSLRGAAGGGTALQVPVPLGVKQRRRKAIMWILEAASNRKSRGSGKNMFAQKVAETVVSVVEGKSDLWAKRDTIHKQGVSARANMNLRQLGRR